MVCARHGDVEHQLIDQAPGRRRLDHWLAAPFVRRETVTHMSVQGGAGTGPVMVIGGV